jgi:hypothetical protein
VEGYEQLNSLRTMLRVKREELKEKLANPMKDEAERERMVGQCVAHAWTIERLGEQIKAINAGDDDAT